MLDIVLPIPGIVAIVNSYLLYTWNASRNPSGQLCRVTIPVALEPQIKHLFQHVMDYDCVLDALRPYQDLVPEL